MFQNICFQDILDHRIRPQASCNPIYEQLLQQPRPRQQPQIQEQDKWAMFLEILAMILSATILTTTPFSAGPKTKTGTTLIQMEAMATENKKRARKRRGLFSAGLRYSNISSRTTPGNPDVHLRLACFSTYLLIFSGIPIGIYIRHQTLLVQLGESWFSRIASAHGDSSKNSYER